MNQTKDIPGLYLNDTNRNLRTAAVGCEFNWSPQPNAVIKFNYSFVETLYETPVHTRVISCHTNRTKINLYKYKAVMEYSLMLKKTLFLVGASLTLSLSVNAAIVDLHNITRDTATGLDWLDLTETNGRSYNDISTKLGAGQEFEGWRYASNAETEQLWQHLGFVDGLNGAPFSESDLEYNFFVTAVSLLGNTIDDYGYEYYETGVFGYTSELSDCCNVHIGGMWKDVSYAEPLVKVQGTSGNWASLDQKHLGYGSYLVAPSAVPIPATGWLFMLALLCLAGHKRLSRP